MHRIDTLLQFYEEDPSDPFTRFALASEYLKWGDRAQALTFFEDLARDHPDYIGTYYHLGKLYEEMDRKDEALETYRQGVQVAREKHDFHALAELQDALMNAEGVGFDDD